MAQNLVTILISAGGWGVAVVTLVIGYFERRAAREEERLAKTLDYFDGGSQRRSIGISMIEGVWLRNAKYHSVLVPVIANQIVYLLLSSDSHDAHNERNLVRLFMLFASIPKIQERYCDRRNDVCDALLRKYEGERKGIPIAPQTLRLWARELGYELPEE